MAVEGGHVHVPTAIGPRVSQEQELLARTNETRAMNNLLIAIRVDLFHFRYERYGEQLNKNPLFPAVLGSVKVRTRLVGRIGSGVRVSANFPKIPSRGSVPKWGYNVGGFLWGVWPPTVSRGRDFPSLCS